MPRRMMAYGVLLHLQLSGHPPVRSVLFLLNKPPGSFQEKIVLSRPGQAPYLQFAFEAVRLYAIPAAQLADDPLLAQLTPLGGGFAEHREDLVAQAADTLAQVERAARVERLGILSLLARARGLADASARGILNMSEVRMSLAYQEILQEGRYEEALKMARLVLEERFGQEHGLDERLVDCSREDLEWVVRAALKVSSPDALGLQLTTRLAGEALRLVEEE